MERRGFSGGQLFLALLGGAVVGAAVALLNAPTSGHELRTRIDTARREQTGRVRRIPTAVRAAYERGTMAAREAFVARLHEGQPDNGGPVRSRGGTVGDPTDFHAGQS